MNSLKQNAPLQFSTLGIRQNHHFSSSVPISQLQSHLLNLWTSYSVDQTYQNLFLAYIEGLKHQRDQSKQIQAEITKTYEKSSLFFLLQQNIQLRNDIKIQVEDQIVNETQNKNYKKPHKVETILRQLCDKLKNLRRINLLISETILKIFEDFKLTRQSNIGSIGKKYIEIFIKIDVQNEFLKESFLNQFILFQKGYDPFFLVHYQEIMKSSNSNPLKKYKPVQELFDITISYVYRLMRAQQKMLKYMLLIEDHAGSQRQRKQLINRQRQLKIANSYKSRPVDQVVSLPRIKKYGSVDKDHFSRASTIKQYYPRALLGKSKDQTLEEQDKDSQCSSCVRKKFHSLGGRGSLVFQKQSLHDSSVYQTPKYAQRNRSINIIKGGDKYLNGKNFDTQEESMLLSRRNLQGNQQRDFQNMYNRKYAPNQLGQQKKWNTRKIKDLRSYLKPIKTQQSLNSEDQIVQQSEYEEKNYRNHPRSNNQTGMSGEYPVYISLKKSKLADEEVEKLTKKHQKYIKDKQAKDLTKKKIPKSSKKDIQESEEDDEEKIQKIRTKNKQVKKQKQPQKQIKKTKNNKLTRKNQLQQSENQQNSQEKVQFSQKQQEEQISEQSGQNYENKSQQSDEEINQIQENSDQIDSEQRQLQQKYEKKTPKKIQKSPKSSKRNAEQERYQEKQKGKINNKNSPSKIQSKEKQANKESKPTTKQDKLKPQQQKSKKPSKNILLQNNMRATSRGSQPSNNLRTKNQKDYDSPKNSQQNFNLSKQKVPEKKAVDVIANPNITPGKTNKKNDQPDKKPDIKNEDVNNNKNNQPQASSQNKSSVLNQNSKIKMLPGKVLFKDFQNYLKDKTILASYKQNFSQNLKFIFASVQNTQTYLNEFTLNDKLAVIALCSPTSSGNIVIYSWAPIQSICDEKTSAFFFKKYIDYIQQQTTFKSLVYRGQQFPEIQNQGFQFSKEKHYLRKRVKPITRQSFQFEYFFSYEMSNISFAQNTKDSLLYSDQIMPFSEKNSWSNPQILKAQQNQMPKQLQEDWMVDQKLKSIKQANFILQKDSYDTFQVGQQKQISFQNINMSRSMFTAVPKQGFIANQGFMIVIGKNLVFADKTRKISKIQLLKETNLYFGQGFESVHQLTQLISKNKNKFKLQDTKFAFKMFSKQLYGKYIVGDKNLDNKMSYYSNWDINFAWRDQIAGKIIHTVQNIKNKYGPQNFICICQSKGILIFGIQITSDDFLY